MVIEMRLMIGFQENLCSRYSFLWPPRVGLKLHQLRSQVRLTPTYIICSVPPKNTKTFASLYSYRLVNLPVRFLNDLYDYF